MEQNEIYDVIIIGGGPSGLSIGSELSKEYKVLILEKEVAGKTARSWFVPPTVLDESVKPFTYGGVSRYLANTFTGAKIAWKSKLFDKYPYVDEKTLLPHWVKTIKDNNSTIINHCAYQDSEVKDGIVSVITTNSTFRSRLLIDASGHNSPILEKYKIKKKNIYWWSIFGCIGEHPDGINDMQVGDYMLWQTFRDTNLHIDTSLQNGRPVFEYEILTENTSFPLILYLRKEKISYEIMEAEFMHVIRKERSTKNFHNIKIKELKHGWYPSGGLSQKIAEDHLIFVGDSACWTTPCGWGMTFILDNYKYFSRQISKVLDDNRLDKKSLLSIPHFKVHEKYEILLNSIITHFLSNASVSQLDKFINLFKIIDPILCEKIFTLTITHEEVRSVLKIVLNQFDLRELIHIVPKDDYLLMLEEAKYFIENAVLDEIHDLFSYFHKNKVKSNLKNGFNFSEAI